MSWVTLLILSAGLLSGQHAKPARDHAANQAGALTVEWDPAFQGPDFVLVSLYRDGELLRSRELKWARPGSAPGSTSGNAADGTVTWKQLPAGVYDVCFEARGYARGVKRVRVSGEDRDKLVVRVELGQEPYEIGDGLRRESARATSPAAAEPGPTARTASAPRAPTAAGALADWVAGQKDLRSLVVEFVYRSSMSPYPETTRMGTFRLLRDTAGGVSASIEMGPAAGRMEGTVHGLLTGGKVYLLDPPNKRAFRFSGAEGDPLAFLGRNFIPLASLLDSKQAADRRVEVAVQDDWYTLLTVRPKKPVDTHWFPALYGVGRVALMHRASSTLPKGAVKQVYFSGGGFTQQYDVRSWQVNPDGGPTAADFFPPEDREGWEVGTWPIHPETK